MQNADVGVTHLEGSRQNTCVKQVEGRQADTGVYRYKVARQTLVKYKQLQTVVRQKMV
jgi:hypothetical protein